MGQWLFSDKVLGGGVRQWWVLQEGRAPVGLDGCGKDKVCLVSLCLVRPVSRSEILAERGSYRFSLWLQERVKAEELMEQRATEQNQPEGEEYQGTDHSSRSSLEPLAPDGRAGPVSRRHKPGSDRRQHPKQTRARDEF